MTVPGDPTKAMELFVGLHKANYSLRKIGEELTLRGLTSEYPVGFYQRRTETVHAELVEI